MAFMRPPVSPKQDQRYRRRIRRPSRLAATTAMRPTAAGSGTAEAVRTPVDGSKLRIA
jgi:hypothetical protein